MRFFTKYELKLMDKIKTLEEALAEKEAKIDELEAIIDSLEMEIEALTDY